MDFVVLNIGKDVKMPIILVRSFLAITHTLIDVAKSKLRFQVNGEELEFNLINKNKYKEPINLVSKFPCANNVNLEMHVEVKSINSLCTNFYGVGTRGARINKVVELMH